MLSSLASTVDRVTPYAQQAWDFAQHAPQVIQAAQQFAGAMGLDGQRPSGGDGATAAAQPGVPAPAVQPSPGGAPPSVEPVATAPPQMAPPYSGGLGQPGAGFDQIAMLLQALTQRQIPPLPAPAPPPAAAVAPVPAAAQPDAFALLRMILTNPQLQQALQSAPASATAAGARVVPLPVPSPAAPRQVRSVPIPLAAVMNAILALAGQSLTELHENVSEEEPEVPAYLVGDDGDFLVDPASDDDRAALVAHLFRLNEAAQRSGRYPQLNSRPGYAGAEQDESDEWARAAGFL